MKERIIKKNASQAMNHDLRRRLEGNMTQSDVAPRLEYCCNDGKLQ
jgi:hypothetical protein